jgi:hypothetical protein
MKERMALGKLPVLALQQRRQGLAKLLPPTEEVLRGSLIERYVSCGNPDCRCARGQKHGPVWYLTVTLGAGRTAGWVVPQAQVDQVRRWIENYRRVKGDLEKISDINHELLRRSRPKKKAKK